MFTNTYRVDCTRWTASSENGKLLWMVAMVWRYLWPCSLLEMETTTTSTLKSSQYTANQIKLPSHPPILRDMRMLPIKKGCQEEAIWVLALMEMEIGLVLYCPMENIDLEINC